MIICLYYKNVLKHLAKKKRSEKKTKSQYKRNIKHSAIAGNEIIFISYSMKSLAKN